MLISPSQFIFPVLAVCPVLMLYLVKVVALFTKATVPLHQFDRHVETM
jgi:hypothetical protein